MDLDALKAAIQRQHRRITGHAILEMVADQVPPGELWQSLLASTARVIEDYPQDPRGPSCLLLTFVKGRPIHIVIAYPAKRHAALMGVPAVAVIITVYRPDERSQEWCADYQTRL